MGLAFDVTKRVNGFALHAAWEMQNEILVLFGHSGAGKSMTLELIAGLREPDDGFIRSGEKVLFDRLAGINLSPQQRSMGYVFQDRVLFPHMTVYANIAYGLRGASREEKTARVEEMISLLHLEGVAGKYPSEISGGQKQRVTLARSLIGRPDCLLLDEPFSALDNPLRQEMWQLLRGVQSRFRIPVVLVTHDLFEAFTLADQVVVYDSGRVVRFGPPGEVLSPPPYAEALRAAEFYYTSWSRRTMEPDPI
jgi:molybdate transport system ATP-binding protein